MFFKENILLVGLSIIMSNLQKYKKTKENI